MLLIGHRGACGYAPENTLLSFEKAIELGVDMIEFDVYALPTGELIIIHDDKVDRTTDGEGFVVDKSFDELRALTLDHDQKIPTLQEALAYINKRVPVNIELKNTGSGVACAKILKEFITNEGWSASMFLVSSFNHLEIIAFRKALPGVKIGALMGALPIDFAAFAERAGADVAIIDAELLTHEFVEDAHARGLELYVYTCVFNDVDRVPRVRKFGVDGMFVNFPDKAREVISV